MINKISKQKLLILDFQVIHFFIELFFADLGHFL